MTKESLLTPAVYALLIHFGGLLDLEISHAEAICRAWGTDEETVDRLNLRAWPTKTQNLFAAHACSRLGDLKTVPGFYRLRDLWWIDLDPKHSSRGFVMPIRDRKYGYISQLVCFRYPKDGKPFPLRVRRERIAA